MKLKILILMSLITWTLTATAQLGKSEFDEYESQKREQNDTISISNRDQTGLNTYAAGSILQSSSDESVAYYLNVAKQWGWFVGIGPALTKEEASHLNVVYKLSHKNYRGHWMKLEAIDGYGSYTTDHSIGTYIASSNDKDSTINADWKAKLASVCQWEFMPDGSGNSVIMERAYDDEKNLIYNYQHVFISDKEIIGSYTDSWGLPAQMSQRGGESEDVLVNIQLDQWGNDSIIKLVDTKGNLLMNSSGSWIQQNICDEKGNVLEKFALNQLGAQMNDNYGNCSWEREADDYGNTLYSAYYDAGNNPVRISEDYTIENVFEKHFEYDQWHRIISKSFYNENKPDTTSQGVHRVEYSYNQHGQIISIKSRGIYGEPKAYGKTDAAFHYCQYDKKGRQIFYICLGPDSTYLKSNNYYFRMVSEYDGDYLKKEENYMYNGIDTILWHFESYSPEVNIYYHREDEVYVDSLDERGNTLSRTYVSEEQDPISLPDRTPVDHSPYSRFVSTYHYAPHSCTKITTWYDKNGNWTRSNNYNTPARTIVTTDSLRHTITHTEFDKDSVMLAHYQEVYDENFSTLKYKQSLTTTGEIGRSGMNDALYYKTKIEYTPTGEVASVLSLNEFDEPAYTYSNYYCYCYQVNDNSGKPVYYDENKNIIKRYVVRSETKAACVEITSESGKANGLKDGDILIRYGDWLYSHNQESYYDFADLYAQMVFSAIKDSIEIWVLRHFTEEKESKIIKLHVKGGTISEIGFAVHEIYYTNKETQRYLRTFLDFKQQEELAGRSVLPTINLTKKNYYARIIVPQYSNRIYSAYSHGWHNPMFLIAKKQDGSSGWPESNNDHVYSYDGERGYVSIYDEGIYLMSEDGISLKCDSLDRYLSNVDNNTVSLSEEEHQVALKLIEQAKDKYPDVFIPNKNEYMSEILRSQPSENSINAYKMIQSLEDTSYAFLEKDATPKILSHVEDCDSVKVFKVFTSDGQTATYYRNLTYLLDKKYYTSQIAPQDSTQIPEKGIAFLHETSDGIDEILYLSEDTVVWAKGNMTHGTKDIIRKNMLGGEYSPLDKYNQEDLKSGNMATRHNIASYWQSLQRYDLSYPIFKKLCKQKYGPAYTSLAKTYINGEGRKIDTTRAISFYENALKYGEPIHRELGKLYYEVQKYKSAIQLLKKDIDLDSYKLIGSIYEFGGNGVKVNLDSALYYYKQGYYYDDLTRVRAQRVYTPNDFKELSSINARFMSIATLDSIGRNYYDNEDYIHAYPYIKAATDSLYPPAEELMAEYMENERFGFNDKQKAQEYRQLAKKHYLEYAEKGNNVAYSMIAMLYEEKDMEGKGIDLDSTKYYYELALQHYDFSVAKTLGDMYKDEYKYDKALDVYLKGALAEQKECIFPVAQLYELDFNKDAAIGWYQKCYQLSEDKEERERAKNALERFGVSISNKLKTSELVGVWVYKDLGVKVFLPEGGFFALYYKDYNNISKEIKDCQFKPWMYGKFYVNGKNNYIEAIERRDMNRYLGDQHMTFQIENDVMKASWENRSNERWVRLSDSDTLIKHIMQNWDSYKKYLQDNLQYSK